MTSRYDYDVIVVGAGHAGVEAACAAAMKKSTVHRRPSLQIFGSCYGLVHMYTFCGKDFSGQGR
jgi:hypothetical protein